MRWRVVVVCVALAAACTKPNPRSCADGTCTDPAFPFCDVGGELEGTPDTCIAVACEANAFESCRGDFAITCNSQGTDFDLIECERGCDDGIGCRLCNPNETACTNGTVATCDANGAVVATTDCPLGCFEDEPRCRDVDPSNGLAQFVDITPNPPDLEFADALFLTDNGDILVGGVTATVPSFLVPAVGNGVPTRVFVVRTLHLSGTTRVTVSGDTRNPPSAGLAIVATGGIHVEGALQVTASAGSATLDCAAGNGTSFIDQDSRPVSVGGGGGGNATDGGAGGAVSGIVNPVGAPLKGLASGTPEIVPFRGGCSGGLSFRTGNDFPSGGGALHLATAGELVIDGTINAAGGVIFEVDQENFFAGGGGAGGSVLLEAASVVIGPDAQLLAGGANGAGCEGAAITPQCRAGGTAATATNAATAGGSVSAPGPSSNEVSSGGGGGGLGRIRINTPTSAFTTSSSSILEGEVTTGELATR